MPSRPGEAALRVMSTANVCTICNIPTEKTGRHYGAVSCYPCRAFFRRAQTRKRKLSCTLEGKCSLTAEAKSCPSCRYKRCLRAGMKPENVLSDEGIRERFKYSRIQPHDGDPGQPLQTAPPLPHLGHFNYNTHPYPGTTLPLPYPGPMMPHPHHFPTQSPPVPAQDKLSPASPAPSYIRVSVIKRAPQPLKVETPQTPPQASSESEPQSDTDQHSDNENMFLAAADMKEEDKSPQSSSSDSDTSGDSDTFTNKRAEDFCVVDNLPPGSETDYSVTNTQDEYEFLILNYVHKKFKRSIVDSGTTVDNECPKDEEDMKVESGTPEGEGDLIISNLGDSMDLDINVSDLESLMYLLTPNLENLETERTLVVEMRNTFDACWRSINFGEKAWSAYIDFCAGKACMDPRIWSFAFLQVRKRFLNFLSSFDLIDLPMRKLFDVLTKNLRVAEGLVYVYQFNAVSWEQEVEFICGDQDLLQWQARHPSIQGTTMKTILQNLPLPEGDKLQLSNSLNELKTPLLQDKTVFILTFLLALLNMEDDSEVRRLRHGIVSLLRKYLNTRFSTVDNMNCVDTEMQTIGRILSALPGITRCISI